MTISKDGYLYQTSLTHISNITAGDTIIHESHMRTVSQSNIKNSEFMGKTIFGDSYILGRKLVEKVTFIKP